MNFLSLTNQYGCNIPCCIPWITPYNIYYFLSIYGYLNKIIWLYTKQMEITWIMILSFRYAERIPVFCSVNILHRSSNRGHRRHRFTFRSHIRNKRCRYRNSVRCTWHKHSRYVTFHNWTFINVCYIFFFCSNLSSVTNCNLKQQTKWRSTSVPKKNKGIVPGLPFFTKKKFFFTIRLLRKI